MDEDNAVRIICFVCLQSDAPIIKFKEDTLQKCKYSLAVRLTNELKDKDKTLPTEITDASIGYHSTCYRSFNAIGKKYKDIYKEANTSIGNENVPGNIPESEAGTSTTQVQSPCSSQRIPSPTITFVDIRSTAEDGDSDTKLDTAEACIFCSKKYKCHKHSKIKLSSTTNYTTMNATKEYATKINDFELLVKIRNKITKCRPITYHRLCKVLYQRRAEQQIRNGIKIGTCMHPYST
ncbi:uncharacterized protein LOC123704785 [Colias croceus]|uniref:uncharacterized protein LOC123704785 n=1 Tax=Colias crocea TaxID=72248 RepID=UPI001E27F0D7|nr:uncharacterized protein LOC123704785 [Colias croceus]